VKLNPGLLWQNQRLKKKKSPFTSHLELTSSNKLDKMLYSDFYGAENGHCGR
jgi:hypothetical protein